MNEFKKNLLACLLLSIEKKALRIVINGIDSGGFCAFIHSFMYFLFIHSFPQKRLEYWESAVFARHINRRNYKNLLYPGVKRLS